MCAYQGTCVTINSTQVDYPFPNKNITGETVNTQVDVYSQSSTNIPNITAVLDVGEFDENQTPLFGLGYNGQPTNFSEVFSFFFGTNPLLEYPGAFIYGEDSDAQDGSPYQVFSPTFANWSLNVASFASNYSTNPIATTTQAYFDINVPSIMLPTDLFNFAYEEISPLANCTYSWDLGTYVCNVSNITGFPTFTIVTANNENITLTPDIYMNATIVNGTVIPGVYGLNITQNSNYNSFQDHICLGLPFFMNKYVVFDSVGQTISLYHTNWYYNPFNSWDFPRSYATVLTVLIIVVAVMLVSCIFCSYMYDRRRLKGLKITTGQYQKLEVAGR